MAILFCLLFLFVSSVSSNIFCAWFFFPPNDKGSLGKAKCQDRKICFSNQCMNEAPDRLSETWKGKEVVDIHNDISLQNLVLIPVQVNLNLLTFTDTERFPSDEPALWKESDKRREIVAPRWYNIWQGSHRLLSSAYLNEAWQFYPKYSTASHGIRLIESGLSFLCQPPGEFCWI